MHVCSRLKVKEGFTLIELLVVISIIAILASILLPSIKIIRDAARNAKCSSNLRQVGLAFHAYADDNEDAFPPLNLGPHFSFTPSQWYTNLLDQGGFLPITTADWFDQTTGNIRKGVWRCPVVPNSGLSWCGGYGVLENPHGLWGSDLPMLRRAMVSSITTRGLMADCEDEANGKTLPAFWCPAPTGATWVLNHRVAPRHGAGRRANVAYMDGHAASAQWTDLRDNADDVWRHIKL